MSGAAAPGPGSRPRGEPAVPRARSGRGSPGTARLAERARGGGEVRRGAGAGPARPPRAAAPGLVRARVQAEREFRVW